MKIKYRDIIVDGDVEPIMLIFNNDDERRGTGSSLLNGFIDQEGIRKFCVFPDKNSDETQEQYETRIQEFMRLD